MDITIGANRERLRKLGQEILLGCDSPGMVDVTVYAELSTGGEEVTFNIGNDDMEGRDDLPNPDVILVDVDA